MLEWFAWSCLFLFGQPTWQSLPSPAGKGAMAVNFHQSSVGLVMSWIEPKSKHEGAIRFAIYNGDKWSQAKTIAAEPDLFINWADIPKVLVGKDLSMAVWPQKLGKGTYAYGLKYSLSFNQGATWQPQAWLHEDLQQQEHGFVSIAYLNPQRIAAVWLDGRMMGGGDHHDHDHGQGSMQLRYREITKQGLTPEVLLDDMTCECCGTDLQITKGQPIAIYRNRTPHQIRDIEMASRRSDGSWDLKQTLPQDQWSIHGCPVNGPALTQQGNTLATAWFTMAKQKPTVRLAYKNTTAKTWQDWGSLGKDPLGRVDLALLDTHHAFIVWLESGKETEEIVYTVVNLNRPADGFSPNKLALTTPGRASGFPKIELYKQKIFIAYQGAETEGIIIKTTAVEALINTP